MRDLTHGLSIPAMQVAAHKQSGMFVANGRKLQKSLKWETRPDRIQGMKPGENGTECTITNVTDKD